MPRSSLACATACGPGILVLEDLDLWGAPVIDAADDMAGFFMAAMSRGAREAVNLIRQAVENPDVFVLASSSEAGEIDRSSSTSWSRCR